MVCISPTCLVSARIFSCKISLQHDNTTTSSYSTLSERSQKGSQLKRRSGGGSGGGC
jgi:hypothetical protein